MDNYSTVARTNSTLNANFSLSQMHVHRDWPNDMQSNCYNNQHIVFKSIVLPLNVSLLQIMSFNFN